MECGELGRNQQALREPEIRSTGAGAGSLVRFVVEARDPGMEIVPGFSYAQNRGLPAGLLLSPRVTDDAAVSDNTYDL